MSNATFGSKDPNPQFSKDNPYKEKYLGPEHRRANRRNKTDRRDEVRFELDASDRRQNPGRRSDDAVASTLW
jgi:hypothetical protein